MLGVRSVDLKAIDLSLIRVHILALQVEIIVELQFSSQRPKKGLAIATMKLSTTYAALLLAASSKLASAKLGFEPMLTSYNAGDNMAIDYWTDSDYSVSSMLPHTSRRPNLSP